MTTKIQIRDKIQEVVRLAEQKYGFNIPYSRLNIEWKSKGQSAASAWQKWGGQYGLKISMESAELDMHEMLTDTIPHEVAHLVCYFDRTLGKNHDAGWKRVCRGLGGSGTTYHTQVLTKARYKSQYVYRTDSGTEVTVGPKIHKGIRMGQTRRLRSTGESFGTRHFVRHITTEEHRREHEKEVNAYRAASGAPVVPSSHNRPTPKPPASQNRPTRTKKVKAMEIYNTYSSSPRAMVIQMFITRLGMTKAGASTYYHNCKKGS